MKQDVWEQLTEWRRTEHLRDELAAGSPAWQEADEEVRRAQTAYRAALAQVTARQREADIPAHRHFWSPVRGQAERSGD
jgi:hypothetical protein